MGTRATAIVLRDASRLDSALMYLYRHRDGSPDVWGKEIKKFLQGITLVQGIREGCMPARWANGMGDLAAQLVAYFKRGPGEFSLERGSSLDTEWVYSIAPNSDASRLLIRVENRKGCLFDGPLDEFDPDIHQTGEKNT